MGFDHIRSSNSKRSLFLSCSQQNEFTAIFNIELEHNLLIGSDYQPGPSEQLTLFHTVQ